MLRWLVCLYLLFGLAAQSFMAAPSLSFHCDNALKQTFQLRKAVPAHDNCCCQPEMNDSEMPCCKKQSRTPAHSSRNYLSCAGDCGHLTDNLPATQSKLSLFPKPHSTVAGQSL